jgi:multidrug efflux system outer membrane protein
MKFQAHSFRLTRIFSAATLAALTACTTVGPDYHVPDNAVVKRQDAAAPFIGANEAMYTDGQLPSKWWQLYQDPQLDALINQAFAANTDLRVASANLERVHAVLDQVEDERRPEIKANFGPEYGRPSAIALLQPEALPNMWLYDTGVNVSYQLDLFGKIKRGIEAATADTQAAEAALDLVRITIAADTVRAYAQACSAGQQIEVAQHSVDLQQQFVKLTEQRVKVGRGTALDMSRVRSQLEQLHATLPPLQAQQRVALYRLAVLTGQVPGKLPKQVEQCSRTPQLSSSSPIPVGDGALLLRRRPDIRQAERTLAGATARIGVATADFYPSVNLGLSVGSTGILTDFGANNAFRWSLGPLISWTFPATGPARARLALAKAGSAAALAHFDATVLNALRETESALTVYARELDRNAALKAARDQSALAASQVHTLYRYGRTDFLTVLDADRTLANAESILATSSAQLATDQVTLFLALGGGWEETGVTAQHKEAQQK